MKLKIGGPSIIRDLSIIKISINITNNIVMDEINNGMILLLVIVTCPHTLYLTLEVVQSMGAGHTLVIKM
jgi:hypothetical protein